MNTPVDVIYECPYCEKEIDVKVYVPRQAKLQGHPDTWLPPEGGEFYPEECECGALLDPDTVFKLAVAEFGL